MTDVETPHRPWGFYEILADEPDHRVKRITVNPGGRLSLQRHEKRMEHWYVVTGKALLDGRLTLEEIKQFSRDA